MTPRITTLLCALALVAGIAALYTFGINNQLVFDDGRLTDGTIFGQYGNLLQLKIRLLSYGSFVWVQDILGEGWWKQRMFNVGLHIATALTLYLFVLQLLQRTQWEQGTRDAPGFSTSLRIASKVSGMSREGPADTMIARFMWCFVYLTQFWIWSRLALMLDWMVSCGTQFCVWTTMLVW